LIYATWFARRALEGISPPDWPDGSPLGSFSVFNDRQPSAVFFEKVGDGFHDREVRALD